MADALNYLSLISALNSSNNVQSLYSNYNPYSAANLYGSSDDNFTSFSNIFGSCINALQSSNTSLLSELGSSINSNVSETDAKQFIETLEEASKDTCNCKSADLVKDLYSAYLSDTAGYAKNRFNSLISSISSKAVDKSSSSASQKLTKQTEDTPSTAGTTSITQIPDTSGIDASIPTEEEIDALIAASLASIPA